MEQKVQLTLKDRAVVRWTALILLAAAMFFGYIFMDALSPLQSALQVTKGWDPETYGKFAGSETFLNVFIAYYPHPKSCIYNLKSATTRLYDTEAKIICIVSKKGAQCIECHHKDI